MAGQLRELIIVRVELDEYKTRLANELAQYEKEKALWAERIESERLKTALAAQDTDIKAKERDLALDKLTYYQSALAACQQTKKRSKWCWVKKLFFGIPKCR